MSFKNAALVLCLMFCSKSWSQENKDYHLIDSEGLYAYVVAAKNGEVSFKKCALANLSDEIPSDCTPLEEVKTLPMNDYLRDLGLDIGSYNPDKEGYEQAKKFHGLAVAQNAAPEKIARLKTIMDNLFRIKEIREKLEDKTRVYPVYDWDKELEFLKGPFEKMDKQALYLNNKTFGLIPGRKFEFDHSTTFNEGNMKTKKTKVIVKAVDRFKKVAEVVVTYLDENKDVAYTIDWSTEMLKTYAGAPGPNHAPLCPTVLKKDSTWEYQIEKAKCRSKVLAFRNPVTILGEKTFVTTLERKCVHRSDDDVLTNLNSVEQIAEGFGEIRQELKIESSLEQVRVKIHSIKELKSVSQ